MYSHNCTTAFTHDLDAMPIPTLPFGTYNINDHYYHNVVAAAGANEVSNNNCCSSGGSSYGGSPTCASTTLHDHHEVVEPRRLMFQRSVSSHSLKQRNNHVGTHRLLSDLLELETAGPAAVRRVYSTGDLDLQRINTSNGVQQVQSSFYRSSSESSPLSSESSMIIEGMSKASRYTPQEKKERIERYRTKRNQRNFNKTIKYACRKTLADSRPRVRGRFVRNDEINQENSPNNVQRTQISGEDDEEDGNSWINLLDAFSSIESSSF